MSFIIQRRVDTTRLRIEPCGGYTTADVCKALNDHHAMQACLNENGKVLDGIELLMSKYRKRVIVLRDARMDDQGRLDGSKIIATIHGTETALTGIEWKPTLGDEKLLGDFFNEVFKPAGK